MALAPMNLPRGPTRPVSYYAFFKGWLLLSQPPGCLCLPTSFPTEPRFWDLSWRSGLFHSSRRTLAPAVCLPCCHFPVFGVCIGSVSLDDPLAETVLYPQKCYPRRYLNSIRGEPAISELDKPFTPIHSSSPTFSTGVSSGLQWELPHLHPGHG